MSHYLPLLPPAPRDLIGLPNFDTEIPEIPPQTTIRSRTGRPRPIKLNRPDEAFQLSGRTVVERTDNTGMHAINSNPEIRCPDVTFNRGLNVQVEESLKNNNSAKVSPPIGILGTSILNLSANALAVVPMLVYAYYTSKDEHQFVIDVHVEAEEHPRLITFSLKVAGKATLIQTLRIEARKPIEFVKNEHETGSSSLTPDSFFNERPLLSTSEGVPYFPVIDKMIKMNTYKRQEFHTQLNILIDDPGASEVQMVSIPFSNFEKFNVVSGDLHSHKNEAKDDLPPGHFVKLKDSKWKTLQKSNIVITEPYSDAKEHRTQPFTLNFTDGYGKPVEMELKVTQIPHSYMKFCP